LVFMAIPDRDEGTEFRVEEELSNIRLGPNDGARRIQTLQDAPPVYYPRRLELIVPPLFLAGIFLALVAAVAMIIPWGTQTADPLASVPALPSPSVHVGGGETPALSALWDEAILFVETDPAGAVVFVDDEILPRGPSGELRVGAGYRLLSVELEGYHSHDTLVVATAATPTRVLARLSPATVAGARGHAEPGRTQPASALEGRSSPQQTSVANRREAARRPPENTAPATPSPAASLSVTVDPSDAEIVINGVSQGRSPLVADQLEGGTYTVSARRSGFEESSRTVVLRPGQSRSVDLRLMAAAAPEGRLAITVRPWGTIYVDGVLLVAGTDLQYTTSAAPGMRRIRATHPQLGASEVTVEVRPGEVTSVVIDLVP
jgi:hypothetical protein